MVVFLTDFDGQDKSLNKFIKFKRSLNEGNLAFQRVDESPGFKGPGRDIPWIQKTHLAA